MNNKPLKQQPSKAVNDEPELALEADELDQLAKFLDALLEADLENRNVTGNSK
jgi:hypothetical protein